jgi:hypothetical protein
MRRGIRWVLAGLLAAAGVLGTAGAAAAADGPGVGATAGADVSVNVAGLLGVNADTWATLTAGTAVAPEN